MSIRLDIESPVVCEICKKDAVRRTLPVTYGGDGGRQVSFDTHNLSLTEAGFFAAIQRMDDFHRRVHALERELNQTSATNRELDKGLLVRFDIDTVHPSACEVRQFIIATAVVSFRGLKGEVRLEKLPLKGQTVAKILSRIRKAAPPLIAQLQETYDSGKY
jgi:hypothetical protein